MIWPFGSKTRHIHRWEYSNVTLVGYSIAKCTHCGKTELA